MSFSIHPSSIYHEVHRQRRPELFPPSHNNAHASGSTRHLAHPNIHPSCLASRNLESWIQSGKRSGVFVISGRFDGIRSPGDLCSGMRSGSTLVDGAKIDVVSYLISRR